MAKTMHFNSTHDTSHPHESWTIVILAFLKPLCDASSTRKWLRTSRFCFLQNFLPLSFFFPSISCWWRYFLFHFRINKQWQWAVCIPNYCDVHHIRWWWSKVGGGKNSKYLRIFSKVLGQESEKSRPYCCKTELF